MLRALASIATGAATWAVLFVGSNRILAWILPSPEEAGAHSSTGLLLLILALSIVYSVIAGWVTFKVDRVRALGSSLGLGAVLLLCGVYLQYRYWYLMPLWYHLAFLGALVPGVLLGYRLAVTRA